MPNPRTRATAVHVPVHNHVNGHVHVDVHVLVDVIRLLFGCSIGALFPWPYGRGCRSDILHVFD
jgi:hypothetical protein